MSGKYSEVILNLYQEKGIDCINELDGMFAFAIFDGDRFLMARDPIGIKPLYYGYHRDHLYFSSELGAMSLAGVDEVHEFPAGHFYSREKTSLLQKDIFTKNYILRF